MRFEGKNVLVTGSSRGIGLATARAFLDQGAHVAINGRNPGSVEAAMKTIGHLIPEIVLCKDAYAACEGADALVIITEWNQFRMLDLDRVRSLLSEPILIDLRNIYEPDRMLAAGFRYVSVGR